MAGSLDARARGVFDQLIDRSGDDRAVQLERCCDGDRALRDRVEALLAAAEKDDAFLREPTLNLVDAAPRLVPAEQPGARIGPYTLVELIGEGGFGSVFLARQSVPMQREVALKIIKAGMDTRQVIARFEAERQALALMDHPHIARVLEAGATDSGRPYFVMELVRGAPITRFCDEHRLSVPQRLALFRDVCSAVQHAHQKGIIHRDLKPSNVLVQEETKRARDEETQCAEQTPAAPSLRLSVSPSLRAYPKVIDFGIAKATAARLTDQTLTGLHQLVGTPEYMSPEQAESLSADIDTRSDIYSLGVLLYELLTGSTPFDRRRLSDSGVDGMRRILRDEDPMRPSHRLQTPADSSLIYRPPSTQPAEASSVIEIARHRQSEPAALSRSLRGDLDWIVMKCLEKDRARRYQTASALAEDIERYIQHQPVLATPPTAGYRFRKFVRRNRAAVISGSLVLAALLIATAVSVAFGLSEARQRAAAERARDDLQAVAEFQQAQLAGIDAKTMGARLRADLLDKVRAAAQRSKLPPDQIDARVSELEALIAGSDFTGLALGALDENFFQPALQAIESQFADQPLVKARLMQASATSLQDLGLFDAAGPPQAAALAIRRSELGDDHLDTLGSLIGSGGLLRAQGKLAEAERTCRDALESCRRNLGDEHPRTLDSMNMLARVLMDQGQLPEAEAYYRQALDGRRRVLGSTHVHTIVTLQKLGSVLRLEGKLAEAEPFCREALEKSRQLLGDDHPHTLIAFGTMASLLRSQGHFEEAETLFREALERSRRVLGADHPDTLACIGNVGGLLLTAGRSAEAEPYLRETLEKRRRLLGPDHPNTLKAITDMGSVLWSLGRTAESESYFQESVERYRRVLGPGHAETLTAVNNLGVVLRSQNRLDEAEPYFREAYEQSRSALGDEHPDTLISLVNLAGVLQSRHDSPAVLALLLPFDAAARRGFVGGNSLHLGRYLNILGCARVTTGELDLAEENLSQAAAIFEDNRSAANRDHENVLTAMIELHDARHDDAGAAAWRSRLAAWRTSTQPAAKN